MTLPSMNVMLEVVCHPYLTRLHHGARGRYICKAPQGHIIHGEVCKAVSIEALWMRFRDVPEWVHQLHARFDME